MTEFLKINSYYLRSIRGLNIGFILLGYFMITWLSRRKITAGLIPKKYRSNGSVISRPARLRMVVERLGPTFVKFGQILADRPDIISDRFRVELKKLQSSAKPFNHDIAMEQIENELGAPIENYFKDINNECIGSASIGQVYLGKLKNGRRVVVKIQRPDIKNKIKLDLELLEFMAGRLAVEYPELVIVDITGVVKEFGEMMTKELNYLNEAGNAIRFAEMFRDVPYCKIPHVYSEISTDKLLVMEYVEGITPDSAERLERYGYNPMEVASNGINIFLKMIFEHGFFHADPHSGNFFIQENNRVAIIDFGMTGALKPSHMKFLSEFTLGLATKRAETISDALLQLSDRKFFKEKEDLEFHIKEMLNRYAHTSYEKVNFSQVLSECVKIIHKFELKIPNNIYLLLKALASLEKLGSNLHSEISLASYIKPYATALVKRQYSPMELAGDVFETLKSYVSLVRTFPGEMSEILYKAKQGKLVHDIEISNQDFINNSLKQLSRRISTVVILGFMFTGSIIADIWGTPTVYTKFIFIISSVLSIWLLVRLFFKTRV